MLACGGDAARISLFVQKEGKVSDAHAVCVCAWARVLINQSTLTGMRSPRISLNSQFYVFSPTNP